MADLREQGVDGRPRALCLDDNAFLVVVDVAGEVQLASNTKHKGSEADALHHSGDSHRNPSRGIAARWGHSIDHSITRLLPESAIANTPPARLNP